MDARERLRIYLEQRRELGESELVLDGMPVDEVMALLGVRGDVRPPRSTKSPVSAVVPPEPRHAAPPRARSDAPNSASASAAPPDATDNAVAPPPAPEVRFDATSNVNWRETLSRADAAPSNASAASSDAGAGSRRAVLPSWVLDLGCTPGIAVAGRAISRSEYPAVADAASIDALADLVRACTRCGLHAGAKNAVPGEGNPQAEFLCVGEAPGANEDEQGRPFVGDAGQLLTKILAAIQLSRTDVFICNVLKHRPPGNRDPLPDEVNACQPFLRRQVELIAPRVILALGRFAAQTLLDTTLPLGRLREQVHQYHGIPVVVTYHPAALLRNEAWKRPAWADVQLARRILDASRAAPDGAREG